MYAILAFSLIGVLLVACILAIKAKFSTEGEVNIVINDETTKCVSVGQTLLSALTHEGIPIPSPCGGKATCKQC
ncbi:MAG TPA: 2Fe-2S iron-sulfur cluster-binding protein, partial [Chlamydiales bacterium]|nr:2Fe-2S iron-sulfur cluster-binding protein [Chlamydiales bacterium]